MFELFEEADNGLESLVEFFIKNCSDYDLDNPFYRSSSETKSVIRSARERETFRGRSGPLAMYVADQPLWADVPHRRKSVFCSSSANGILVPMDKLNIIIPVNGTKIAISKLNDFNMTKIKMGTHNLLIEDLVELISKFSTLVHSFYDEDENEKFADGMRQILKYSKMKITDDVIIRHAKAASILIDDANEIFESIDWIIKILDPANMGVHVYTTKNIKINNKKPQEIWFEGKYLSIKESDYEEFYKLVKKER